MWRVSERWFILVGEVEYGYGVPEWTNGHKQGSIRDGSDLGFVLVQERKSVRGYVCMCDVTV